MKTIRISRERFSGHGMHSWLTYFIFILSKKYNVIIDAVNPDIVICSNLHYDGNVMDTFLNCKTLIYDRDNKNIKFVYVSGEKADFNSNLHLTNHWAIGYQKISNPKYLHQPSGAIDVWTLFDECRIVDSPNNWLTQQRDFNTISNRNTGFCSITQNSNNEFRGKVFDKLCEYKTVSSSGPWRQNLFGADTLNRHQWLNSIYSGRMDGLTYREKIQFFSKFKFNIAIHYIDTPYILQEKIFHAYVSGAIPVFHGNKHILEYNFNPDSFINLHEFDDLNDFLDLVKKIDTDETLYRKYIAEPIYVDNKLPEYMSYDHTSNFLDKIVDS